MEAIKELKKSLDKLRQASISDLLKITNEDIVELRSCNRKIMEFTNLVNINFNQREDAIKKFTIEERIAKSLNKSPWGSSVMTIYDYIKQNPGLTKTQLHRLFPPSSVNKAIQVLEFSDKIYKIRGEKMNTLEIYPKIPKTEQDAYSEKDEVIKC